MLKMCPNCQDEREFNHGMCQECGEEYISKKKKEDLEFEEEDPDWDAEFDYE